MQWNVLSPSIRKHWSLILGAMTCALFSACFEGFSIGMLIPFLQNLSVDEGSGFQTGFAWIDTTLLGVGLPTLERTYRICGVILLATWLRTVFSYLSSYQGIKARSLVVEDVQNRIVEQLQAVSLRFFSTTRTGELVNTVTNELGRVSHAFHLALAFVTQSILLCVYAAFMFYVSWELSLIVVVFFGLLWLGLSRLVRLIRTSGRAVTEASGAFTSRITEFISGIRTVAAFNMQGFERDRLEDAAHEYARSNIATYRKSLAVMPISQAVFGTVLVAIIVVATQFFVLPGKLDVALLLAFLFALFRLVPTAHSINRNRGEWAGLYAAIDNVADLLRRGDKPYMSNGSQTVPVLQDAISFRDVAFAYEEGEPVLHTINFRVARGKTTAIVGASGSGKSTLVDLIPRFYDPVSGAVCWDGTDVRRFDVRHLRSRIAIVSQSTFVFNDTVRANIAYGTENACFEDIREAAREANALAFIEEMRDGFDTVLGDQGIRVSGGQRQRIAIARALLCDPDILILDEATSALDSVSERLVQESLERLMEGRTVVAVAHRLSTIENADWIVVLEGGRVVEQGTYADLLERRGQLWTYHSLQFQTPAERPAA